MTDDAAFLRAIAATPVDDTTRLVYADFLDERAGEGDGARAEFLRLTVRVAARDCKKAEKKAGGARLQELAAGLAGDWLAVVSRLAVENCQARRRPSDRVQFAVVCERKWDELTPTDAPAVRHCGGCREDVHYCDTIGDARRHAALGHCVAVDLGIIRRHGDLHVRLRVEMMTLGLVLQRWFPWSTLRPVGDYNSGWGTSRRRIAWTLRNSAGSGPNWTSSSTATPPSSAGPRPSAAPAASSRGCSRAASAGALRTSPRRSTAASSAPSSRSSPPRRGTRPPCSPSCDARSPPSGATLGRC